MPAIVRKSHPALADTRREVLTAVSWHVRSNAWKPLTDVYETESSLFVKIEIAGLRDEDLEVAIQENILLISGLRSDLSERRAYHQMEIPFGKFEVAVTLPVKVDMENARAEYKDGFLTITLPKLNLKKIEVT